MLDVHLFLRREQNAFLVERFFVHSRSVRLAREPPQNPINFPIKLICTRMSCIEDLARIWRAHDSVIFSGLTNITMHSIADLRNFGLLLGVRDALNLRKEPK
jgi:hypothetical protein